MKTINLFGELQPIEQPRKRTNNQSFYQRFKIENNYRLATNKHETCKDCFYLITYYHHNGKRYHKCQLIGVSKSEATDIRLKNVCNKFMARI